ncbi:MAG: restriction endonuclease subunit R [Elainellaceae cyanobacterium]
MGNVISVEEITLYDLQQRFGLQQVDPQFFNELFGDLPGLTEIEMQRLKRLQAIYANLATRSVFENTVKMAIVSPLLDLAGFYLPPFYIDTEEEVQIEAQENGVMIRGRIDVLVLKDQFWILVIESKRAEFPLKTGIPQALTYMLANPEPTQPLYGMVTNGSHFVFLKLMHDDVPRYARSQEFRLEEENELGQVLQVLKRLAGTIALNASLNYDGSN